jgi:hypothetical protein
VPPWSGEPDPNQFSHQDSDPSQLPRQQATHRSWPVTRVGEGREALPEQASLASHEHPEGVWISCPACRTENAPSNHFCGFCGVQLPDAEATPAATQPLRELLESRPPGMAPPSLPGEELQFLRYRTQAEAYDPDESAHHGWIYLTVGLIAVLSGFLAFDRYYKPPMAAPLRVPTAMNSQPPVTNPAEKGEEESTARELAPASASPVSDEGTAVDQPSTPDTREIVKPAARILNTSTLPNPGAESGTGELQAAKHYMQEREPAEAARWLWKAVAKENGEAAVMLADLYLRGEGVPQSCGQARVLLSAAASHGSAGAAGKLRSLDSSCK